MGKRRRKSKIFQAFLCNGKQKNKINKSEKKYIHRIFVINVKAVFVQLA